MLAFALLLHVHRADPRVRLLLRRLLSHSVALLNPADQLVLFAGDLLQVVIRELPPARANAALQLNGTGAARRRLEYFPDGETILRPQSMSPPAKRSVTRDGRLRAALFVRWEVFCDE